LALKHGYFIDYTNTMDFMPFRSRKEMPSTDNILSHLDLMRQTCKNISCEFTFCSSSNFFVLSVACLTILLILFFYKQQLSCAEWVLGFSTTPRQLSLYILCTCVVNLKYLSAYLYL